MGCKLPEGSATSFAGADGPNQNAGPISEQNKPSTQTGLIGRYVYCILEGDIKRDFGRIGIDDLPVHTVYESGVTAVVSAIPYKQMDPNLQQVMAHQRVVESARSGDLPAEVVLPVRFGVVIKGEEGVRKLLQSSLGQYKEKMRQLRGRDEIGIKVMLNKDDAAKFRRSVEVESQNIQKIKDEIKSSPNQGRVYFLNMKLQDAIKTETLKKIGAMASSIHSDLSEAAERTVMLKSDVSQVILNASYLVERNKISLFEQKVAEQKQRFSSYGLTIHMSGPWAPYSFC
jgi:Gas vesicle synthesis protein GvpL/GvpF